jgi:phosphate/sulfate permease
MSQPSASSGPGEAEILPEPDEPIQFDHAEYSTPAPQRAVATCTSCGRPIADVYFETGGKVVCGPCRQRIEEAFRGGPRVARAMRAFLLGTLAAIAGAILYYVVMRVTGYNIGLIAVVVGLMVGGGVRRGSGNRGGRFYQVLALFLTYSAISAMHLPYVVEGFFQNLKKQAQDAVPAAKQKPNEAAAKPEAKIAGSAVKQATQPAADNAAPQPRDATNPQTKDRLASTSAKSAEGKEGQAGEDQPNFAVLFIGLAFLLVFAFISPVLIAVHAPISGFIYAFALWEAWKINRKVELTFNGPFRVSSTIPEGGLSPEVVADGG